jgi:hypothetical protein
MKASHWSLRAYEIVSQTVKTPNRASSCSTKADMSYMVVASSGTPFKYAYGVS